MKPAQHLTAAAARMRPMARILSGFALVRAWVLALARAVREEGLDYRAASLAYTTLLSIVPGLALSFSLLRTFGVDDQLEPLLLQMLAPLGDKGPALTETILGYVKRVNVGVLGFVGLVVLIYTIVAMLEKTEAAFNHIWRVSQSRSLARRAGDYLSVILLGPVLIFSAIGLTASMPAAAAVRRLISHEPFALLFYLGGKLLPYGLIIAAFTFVYIYIPNTCVPWRAALFGGTVGGLLWKLAGLLFARFLAGSSSYHAIYSSLVIVILFMIWLDFSWLILLLGGQAALFFQHPQYVRGKSRYAQLGNRLREQLGLSLMYLIAGRLMRGETPWTVDALAERLALPWETVKDALEVLRAGGLVEETARGDESYVPAADIAGVTLDQVRRVMRQGPGDGALLAAPGFTLPEIAAAAAAMERAAAETPAARLSLREFLLAQEAGAAGEPVIRP